MEDLTFIKEIFAVIASVTAILAAIGALILWMLKCSFQKGEMYHLFKSLVTKVGSIEEMIEDKFLDNDAKHRKHADNITNIDKRVTVLEVTTDAKINRRKADA